MRALRGLVDPALKEPGPRFEGLYAGGGRPSIAPEKLLRALLLQVLYTVHIDGFDGRLAIDSPVLPDGIRTLSIEGLRVGTGSASFTVRGSSKGATVEITDKRGPISIEVKS